MTRPLAAVVFGGRSPIAVSCAESLAQAQDVVLVTRRIDDGIRSVVAASPRIALVEADLGVTGESRRVIDTVAGSGRDVNAVVFLQRYRSAGSDGFQEHAAVELWSVKEALEAIKRTKLSRDSQVHALVSSSPAAQTVLMDQSLEYHVIKAGQEALVRFYAASLARHNISINALRIGSVVLKPRAEPFWTSVPEVVKGLNEATPAGHLLTSGEVGQFMARLVSAGLAGMTGQTITLDGGASLRDGIQMVRHALEGGHGLA
jgi:NAD(P)-dependent dehydrogenase (short-subunit alcohol dehydrogenase family)